MQDLTRTQQLRLELISKYINNGQDINSELIEAEVHFILSGVCGESKLSVDENPSPKTPNNIVGTLNDTDCTTESSVKLLTPSELKIKLEEEGIDVGSIELTDDKMSYLFIYGDYQLKLSADIVLKTLQGGSTEIKMISSLVRGLNDLGGGGRVSMVLPSDEGYELSFKGISSSTIHTRSYSIEFLGEEGRSFGSLRSLKIKPTKDRLFIDKTQETNPFNTDFYHYVLFLDIKDGWVLYSDKYNNHQTMTEQDFLNKYIYKDTSDTDSISNRELISHFNNETGE